MKILIVTDAWHPQVNGVVRSIDKTLQELQKIGHSIDLITPQQFWNVPLPLYSDISIAIGAGRNIKNRLQKKSYDAIHIATEGPLGFAARQACKKLGLHFTTAYHTKFPEYLNTYYGIPTRWTSLALRWFHSESQGTMVSTNSLKQELLQKGHKNLQIWSRGVDTELFHPKRKTASKNNMPTLLYVGRVSAEKNIESFLQLKNRGKKIVVGDGPYRQVLTKKYPEAIFVGFKSGKELAKYYASADVFVFPSKTDTFGLVLLEALACGTPVAAYPVEGPLDVVGTDGPGVLSNDLEWAVQESLKISPEECRTYALQFSWKKSAQQFLQNLILNQTLKKSCYLERKRSIKIKFQPT